MRILIYGAGVIGCTLASRLHRGGNDVTLLARNQWKDYIDHKGVRIHHYGYFHTTVDKIPTIDKLEADDRYDLIFTALPYNQILDILDQLEHNISRHIVLVGNNINPHDCEYRITNLHSNKKQVAFGFQVNGGYKNNNEIISIHGLKIKLIIGGYGSELQDEFKNLIKVAFLYTRYKINFRNDMEQWLLSHAAHMIANCYICYAAEYNLMRLYRQDIEIANAATKEVYEILNNAGCSIYLQNEYIKSYIKYCNSNKLLYLMYKIPLFRSILVNQCIHAAEEIYAIDKKISDMRKEYSTSMPAWDKIKKNLQKVLINRKINKVAARKV